MNRSLRAMMYRKAKVMTDKGKHIKDQKRQVKQMRAEIEWNDEQTEAKVMTNGGKYNKASVAGELTQ